MKIVQSNFPDSIYLPLVVSLFGETIPQIVVFIEGEEIYGNNQSNLINWVKNSIYINNK